jgi:hypothetical protein
MEGSMMFIDMTNELIPILVGIDVLLAVSALAIVAHATAHSWSRLLGYFDGRRFTPHRPVLAR